MQNLKKIKWKTMGVSVLGESPHIVKINYVAYLQIISLNLYFQKYFLKLLKKLISLLQGGKVESIPVLTNHQLSLKIFKYLNSYSKCLHIIDKIK